MPVKDRRRASRAMAEPPTQTGPSLVNEGSNSALAEQLAGGAVGPGTPTLDAAAREGAGGSIDDAALEAASTAVLAIIDREHRSYAEVTVPHILRQSAELGVRNARQVAYLLATADHESRFGAPRYARSQSMVEDNNRYSQLPNGRWTAVNHLTGKTLTADSEEALDILYWDECYGKNRNLENEDDTTDGANYRGRGLVQLTGRKNYREMSEYLAEQGFSYTQDGVTYGGRGNPPIDLLTHFDHVNKNPALAARILVYGSTEGTFTGRALGSYVNDRKTDYTNARSVINGDTEKNGRAIADLATRYASVLSPLWRPVFGPAALS